MHLWTLCSNIGFKGCMGGGGRVLRSVGIYNISEPKKVFNLRKSVFTKTTTTYYNFNSRLKRHEAATKTYTTIATSVRKRR